MNKFLASVSLLLGLSAFAEPAITLDRVQQRYPWNGLVDIDYTVSGVINPFVYRIELFVTSESGKKIRATTFLAEPDLSNGSHRLSWNAKSDGADYLSKNAQFRLSLRFAEPATDGDYMVIDLSRGPDASVYNVTYLSDIADPTNYFNTTEYKTTKIVLKKIKAGSFWMGSPDGGAAFGKTNEKYHYVTLTNDYFIGMFLLTGGQYVRVAGGDMPAWTGEEKGLTGKFGETAQKGGLYWLSREDGFLARLNSRAYSSLSPVTSFGIPTEAQWEYACRAGTTTPWFFGETAADFSQYAYVGSTAPVVGSKRPNPWCLWDLYGYLQEYVRDNYLDDSYPDSTEENPDIEPCFTLYGSGNMVMRGAASWQTSNECRSAYRTVSTDNTQSTSNGFRLAIPCHGSGGVIE